MNTIQLLALRARCWTAKVNKHLIGAAEGYAAALKKEAGPVDFHGHEHSPEHLIALIERVIRVRNAPKVPDEVQTVTKPIAPKPAAGEAPKPAAGEAPKPAAGEAPKPGVAKPAAPKPTPKKAPESNS